MSICSMGSSWGGAGQGCLLWKLSHEVSDWSAAPGSLGGVGESLGLVPKCELKTGTWKKEAEKRPGK